MLSTNWPTQRKSISMVMQYAHSFQRLKVNPTAGSFLDNKQENSDHLYNQSSWDKFHSNPVDSSLRNSIEEDRTERTWRVDEWVFGVESEEDISTHWGELSSEEKSEFCSGQQRKLDEVYGWKGQKYWGTNRQRRDKGELDLPPRRMEA